MAGRSTNRTLTLFYILVIYVMIQFGWWAYLLMRESSGVGGAGSPDEEVQLRRFWMVVGEGSVFLLLLLMGVWRVRKSFRDEVALGRKEQNFLLSVSHEFKSPLASLRLQLETLRSRKVKEEQVAELAAMALEDTKRLTDLVDNMLLAARIENGRKVAAAASIDLSTLVRDTVSRWQARNTSGPKAELSVEDHCMVSGEEPALQSVLENLLSNAWKYSPDKGQVWIRLYRKGNQAVLEVEDQGPGIPDEEKEKIFERFYRMGREETRTSKGTGLGLYIAKHITEQHGGRVEVAHGKTGGARFVLRLPVIKS